MKRISAQFVVSLALLTLTACSPDASSKQQADAVAAFTQAQKKIADVASGYIHSEDPNYPGTLVDYQRKLLNEAVTELAPLTTAGSEGQQVASALALANAHAILARFDSEEAVQAAADLAPLSDRAIATLVTAQAGQTLADNSSKIDNSNSVDAAQRAITDAQTQSDRLSQDIAKLNAQIAAVDKTVADLTKQRDAAMKQSADLRARAFEANGQIRFDLHTKAAGLAVNADKLSGQIDLQNVERNKLDALRVIATIQKQQIDSRAEAAERAKKELMTQNATVNDSAKRGTETANAAAANLLEQLQSLSKDFDQNVVAKFDSARAHLEQSVKTLAAATGKGAAHASDVKLQYAVRQAELGHLLRQAAVLYQGHADLLKLIADKTQSNFPAKQGQEIRGLASTAADKAKSAASDALTALQTADDYLTQALENSPSTAATQAALRQQELVCLAGGQLGDQKLGDKAADVHSKIKG